MIADCDKLTTTPVRNDRRNPHHSAIVAFTTVRFDGIISSSPYRWVRLVAAFVKGGNQMKVKASVRAGQAVRPLEASDRGFLLEPEVPFGTIGQAGGFNQCLTGDRKCDS